MDSASNRHIVKVMSQDRKQLHATLLAIPHYSNDRPSDQPQVRFMETPAANGGAATNAIKIWFYPGNSIGHEFIYPRDKAMRIAAAHRPAGVDDEDRRGVVGADASLTATWPWKRRRDTEVEQQPLDHDHRNRRLEPQTRARSAPARPTPPAADRSEAEPRPAPRTDLPNTAGALPLLALMGLGSVAGSRMLRRARPVTSRVGEPGRSPKEEARTAR